MIGRPGTALWLLGHEIRLGWRRVSSGRMGPRTQILLVGFLLAMWGLGSWTIFRPIAAISGAPHISPESVLALSIVLVFLGAILISQTINGAVEAIYTRNDLDLLLASPLQPWTILIVRAVGIALAPLQFWAFVITPPLVVMSIFGSPAWLSVAPALLVLGFAATGIALLLATAMMRLIGPRQTRIVAQITAALMGGGLYIAAQAFNLSNRHSDDTPAFLQSLVHLRINPDAPWFLPARAALGDPLSLLLWIVVAAGCFALGVRVLSGRFVRDAAAIQGMSQGPKRLDASIRAMRSGISRSLLRKEFRLLARDPVLLSKIGLQLVYFVPIALILLTAGDGGFTGISVRAMVPTLTFFASSLASSLIWITLCAEDAPDLVASAPVARARVERAKLAAAVLPVWALFAIPVGLVIASDAGAGMLALLGVSVGPLATTMIAVWRQAPLVRKSIMRRAPKETQVGSIGQMVVSAGWTGTISLLVYGVPWLALIAVIVTAAVFGAFHREPALRGQV
ncbi:MAG: hypothetical protein R3C52_00865 [Hyphomonadaceae bacterium]